jgi:hypothetical protein
MAKTSEPLTCTFVRVYAHRGANKQPSGGYANFSDGKRFDWHVDVDGNGVTFGVYAKNNGRRHIRLPKRQAALFAALEDGRNVYSAPIKITL